MANEIIQTRVPGSLKEEAEALFADMGLNLSDAIRMFLQQSVNEGGIPFRPRAKRPSVATIGAVEELENGGGKKHESVASLFTEWAGQ